MDHTQVQKRLLDFQDAELSEQERRQMGQHVQSCQECRRQLEHWEKTRQALSHSLEVLPSEAFLNQVMSKVEAIPAYEPVVRRRWLGRLTFPIPERFYPEFGIAAAALVLLALASFQKNQGLVSAEGLLLSRLPRDIQWVGQTQSPSEEGLDFLWEEV